MASNLRKKPFLDYQAQIKYLKQKQLVINNEVSATAVLEKVSYYGLINGYKDVLKILLQITSILILPLMISIIYTCLMLN